MQRTVVMATKKRKALRPAEAFTRPPEEISVFGCYSIAEFRQRAGLSLSAWRAVRRKGLPVRRIGKRHFVLGLDWWLFLAFHGD